MKTPREILLERHRQAESKLDVVRREVLAEIGAKEALNDRRLASAQFKRSGTGAGVAALVHKLWLELVWPYRRAWAGLAVLWVGVLAANLEMKAGSPRVPVIARGVDRALAQAVEEQRRVLAELLPPARFAPIEPGRPNARPRSERAVGWRNC